MSMKKKNSIADARRKIAKDYCRVVAVIDDEIYESDSKTVTDRFHRLRVSCETQGILCHLLSYALASAGSKPAENKERTRAITIAENADVIVLDWQLGGDNPENCIHILKKLAKGDRVKYVAIYSKHPIPDIRSQLLHAMPKLVPVKCSDPEADAPPVEEEPDDGAYEKRQVDDERSSARETDGTSNSPGHRAPEFGAEAEGATSERTQARIGSAAATDNRSTSTRAPIEEILCCDNKLFIAIHRKATDDAQNLIAEIHECLLCSFPDSLHWAGLEMAVDARELLPRVIAALPSATDAALQYQLLFNKGSGVADQVAEVLLDELRMALRKTPLTAVRDDSLFEALRARMKDLFANDDRLLAVLRRAKGDLATRFETHLRQVKKKGHGNDAGKQIKDTRDRWDIVDIEVLRQTFESGEKIEDYFPSSSESKSAGKNKGRVVVSQYIFSDETGECARREASNWARARESVLMDPSDRLEFGSVWKRQKLIADDVGAEWLLCITPGCDLARGVEAYQRLFVVGTSVDGEPKSSPSQTQSCVGEDQVVWEAKNPITMSEVDLRERYSPSGKLRAAFAARVGQRVWTWQSRVAVETSELIRVQRGE